MTRKIFITSATIIILIFLGVWMYLLLFGVPNSTRQTFSNFGLINPTEERPLVIEEDNTNQLAPNTKLQQLTTRAVAGFVYTNKETESTSTTSPLHKNSTLRYAERGTGHVYEIDLNSGVESQVSKTTVGQTVTTHFSPDGKEVVFQSETTNGVGATRLTLGVTEVPESLPAGSDNFGWSNTNILHYTISSQGVTTGYNNEGGVSTIAWQVPMVDINVYWGADGDIIINDPAPNLRSGVFKVTNDKLEILVPPQYALFGFPNQIGNFIYYSHYDPDVGMVSKILDLADGSESVVVIPAIPEKCDFSTAGVAWCASQPMTMERDDLTTWYRGEETFSDSLWQTDLSDTHTTTAVAQLSTQAGFALDVTALKVSEDNKYLFFLNKTNDTLWKYEI